MEEWVRRCERCHHVDFTRRWPTADEADAAIAADEAWRCAECGADRPEPVVTTGIGGG